MLNDNLPKVVAGGFARPYGIAVDAIGNIYVANWIGNHIDKMMADGSNKVQ